MSRSGVDARPFDLDRFQREAIEIVDLGESVVVAAPTGSGKTVIAEHAIDRARQAGRRAFYTTPIKALSNQKYRDLGARHGEHEVGLLTGDNSINGDAPVVVMTTEVLRNMLYSDPGRVDRVQVVVLDEVHYLEDAYRGPVWEEVIIHLPPQVQLVCLSATISNAHDLASWIDSVRGPTRVVVEHTRPIALEHKYLVGERGSGRLRLMPLLVDGRPNPDGWRYDHDPRRTRGRPRSRWTTPSRVEVLQLLEREGMVPAIYFLFSRAGCDEAVQACRREDVSLTDPGEQQRIRAIAAKHTAGLDDDERLVLGHERWLQALEAGVAAHHAGMVPPFKEAVESCFVEGLVKVVFATETLALGINMPARAVVIEHLTKWTGERHEFLTPGQYSQLTGRAGRRGIDDRGHAIVLWSPWVPFRQIATLAKSRDFVLRSAFRPTYNMAANLVRRHEPAEAHRLLQSSFGQWQLDHEAVIDSSARDDAEGALEIERELLGRALPPDWTVDAALAAVAPPSRAPRPEIEAASRLLRPGAVTEIDGQMVAVLSVAQRGDFSRLTVVDREGRVRRLHSSSLHTAPVADAHLELPSPFVPDQPATQRAVAASLRRTTRDSRRKGPSPLRPELAKHARRVARLADQLVRLEEAVTVPASSLADEFDRVLRLLEDWGCLTGWALTSKGERLARVYHESDLLLVEALDRGLFDHLDAPSMSALVSCFTYERRGPGERDEHDLPTTSLAARWTSLDRLWAELDAAERRARLASTRRPDPGLAGVASAWASGHDLEQVLLDGELSGGDFVRNIKQLVDLLRQVGEVAAEPDTRDAARSAAESLVRGVVEVSSVLPGEAP